LPAIARCVSGQLLFLVATSGKSGKFPQLLLLQLWLCLVADLERRPGSLRGLAIEEGFSLSGTWRSHAGRAADGGVMAAGPAKPPGDKKGLNDVVHRVWF
jgi:hypothetical protein